MARTAKDVGEEVKGTERNPKIIPFKPVRFEDEPGKGMWDSEELEDLITKSIFAIYEQRWHPPVHPKRLYQDVRPEKEDIDYIRNKGIYFPPSDSAMRVGYVDIKRHGLPEHGDFFTTQHNPDICNWGDIGLANVYLYGFVARLVKAIGPGWIRKGPGIPYRVFNYFSGETGIACMKGYLTVDQDSGRIVSCQRATDKYKILHPDIIEDIKKQADMLSVSLWNEGERAFLWNVAAIEGKAKVSFGVHEEQVQSLFYARELPMSETGRKRPILHWVASHQRRIRAGIEVDVKKHMRGVTEFVMNETQFKITNPPKKEEERDLRRLRKIADINRAKKIYTSDETHIDQGEGGRRSLWEKIREIMRILKI